MKNILFTLVFLLLSFSVVSQNLVRNASLTKARANGMPADFTASTHVKRVKLPSGEYAIQMEVPAGKTTNDCLQMNLDVKFETDYEFSANIKLDKNSEVLFFVESSQPTWKTFASPWIKGAGDWQKVNMNFNYASYTQKPYMGIRLKGLGKIMIKDIVISNAGFSKCDFSKGIEGWTKPSGKVRITDSDPAHSKVLELSTKGSKRNSRINFENVRLKGGKKYLLTYDVKGGIDKAVLDVTEITTFRVFIEKNGRPLGNTGRWRETVFYNWGSRNVVFKVDENIDAKLVCEVKSPGAVHIDNIQLQETKTKIEPVKIMLYPPTAFGNGVFSSQKNVKSASGRVKLNIPGARKVKMSLNGNKKIYSFRGNQVKFTLPVPKKTGEYPLKAQVMDAKGKVIKSSEITFTVYPKARREITFDKDHIMYINGKPFFPIGVWSIHSKKTMDKKFATVADMGFNFVNARSPFLDLAQKHGLFTMVHPWNRELPTIKGHPELEKRWKENYTAEFKKIMNHPSLIAYFMTDEPALASKPIAPLKEAYKFIKSLDPYKPVQLNEAPRGKIANLREYIPVCDVYGADIYPVPAPNGHSDLKDKMMTSVGKYTDRCQKVVEKRLPVWMVVQGFAWGAIQKNPQRIVYPTRAQDRFMAYNAITHGSTGLMWFGLDFGKENPEYLKSLSKTIKEVRSISPVLVTPFMKTKVKCNKAKVRIMQRKLNGEDYYIVVNESGDKFTATFTGKFSDKLAVLFENRSVTVYGGEFKDSFKPYDVHIYSTSAKLPEPLELPKMPKIAKKNVSYGEDYRKGNWIWSASSNNYPNEKLWFKREFTLPVKFKKVELFVTGDDRFQMFLNDKLTIEHTSSLRNFDIIDYIDVTKQLKTGKNTLSAEVMNVAGVGAFFCVIRITDSNGKVSFVKSDTSFLVSKDKRNWEKCKILAPCWGDPWAADLQGIAQADNKYLGQIPL